MQLVSKLYKYRLEILLKVWIKCGLMWGRSVNRHLQRIAPHLPVLLPLTL